MTGISKHKFYILSFTYGLPMSIVGLIIFAFCKFVLRKKIKKYGYAYYAEVGKGNKGCEFGWFFVVGNGASDFTKTHELGHTYQNACIWGWLMLPVVGLPSFLRFWYRTILTAFGYRHKTGYYDIWFERQANELGELAIK